MATLTFNGTSYTVNHAVKGADYIHGYDAEGNCVVSFEGVTNFSAITYSGTYMTPENCLDESCNDVKFHDGSFKRPDGSTIIKLADLAASAITIETIRSICV